MPVVKQHAKRLGLFDLLQVQVAPEVFEYGRAVYNGNDLAYTPFLLKLPNGDSGTVSKFSSLTTQSILTCRSQCLACHQYYFDFTALPGSGQSSERVKQGVKITITIGEVVSPR